MEESASTSSGLPPLPPQLQRSLGAAFQSFYQHTHTPSTHNRQSRQQERRQDMEEKKGEPTQASQQQALPSPSSSSDSAAAAATAAPPLHPPATATSNYAPHTIRGMGEDMAAGLREQGHTASASSPPSQTDAAAAASDRQEPAGTSTQPAAAGSPSTPNHSLGKENTDGEEEFGQSQPWRVPDIPLLLQAELDREASSSSSVLSLPDHGPGSPSSSPPTSSSLSPADLQLLQLFLELLRQAPAALKAEVDIRPFQVLFAQAHPDLLLHVKGMGILHWLVCGAPALPPQPTAPIQPAEAARLLSGSQELFHTSWSFQLEPLLDCLLAQIYKDEDQRMKFIDTKDQQGNTALHWAANMGRADLMGLLLRYGADISLKNAQGLTAFDTTEWDRAETATQAAASNGSTKPSGDQKEESKLESVPAKSGALVCPKCTKVYQHQFRFDAHAPTCDGVLRLSHRSRQKTAPARTPADSPAATPAKRRAESQLASVGAGLKGYRSRVPSPTMKTIRVPGDIKTNLPSVFGVQYGLLLHANQYYNESGRAACKRLLFQAALQQAADRGDDGDREAVERWVEVWLKADMEGCRMHPLCYRLNDSSPLYTAVSYERNYDNCILKQLLHLPFLYYTQCGARQEQRDMCKWRLNLQRPLLIHAASVANVDGMKLLLEAGVDVNMCDEFDGAPTLAELDQLPQPLRRDVAFLLLEHGASLVWNAANGGRARCAFKISEAIKGKGVSEEIMQFIAAKKKERNGASPRTAPAAGRSK